MSKGSKFKFDLVGIVMMIIAIAIGQYAGSYLIGLIGGNVGAMAGGLVGSLITGLVVYAIYTFITGGKFGLLNAVIFAVLIYAANLGAGYVASMLGQSSGYISLVIAGVFASFLWGWVGGKAAKRDTVKAPKI